MEYFMYFFLIWKFFKILFHIISLLELKNKYFILESIDLALLENGKNMNGMPNRRQRERLDAYNITARHIIIQCINVVDENCGRRVVT